MARFDEIIYVNALVKFSPINSKEKKFAQVLKDFKIDKFFTYQLDLTLEGFNKPSKGSLYIPINESYTELGLENLKNNPSVYDEIKTYKNKRDIFHDYLLENKWLPIEIFFCEKDSPFEYETDLELINSSQFPKVNPNNIQLYKVFDGLGYKAQLKYNARGHYIKMDIADRLILLENDILEGNRKNTNTIKLLQEICYNADLKLNINKGVPFKNNLFSSKNKASGPFSIKEEQFNILNKNLGRDTGLLNNKTLADNFLLNAKKSMAVLNDLAKVESAIFYVRGKDFYFGGIDKSKFQNVAYTWGKDIFDLDIDIVIPKPLKDDESYPYYIELRGYDAVRDKEIFSYRGKKPPKKAKSSKSKDGTISPEDDKFVNVGNLDSKNSIKYIENGYGEDENNSGNGSGGKRTGKPDESSQTIFIYEKILGVDQEQLDKISLAMEYALQHGALQGEISVPIDYSLSPFDTLMLKNVGTTIEKYVFNIEAVIFKFDVNNGIQQSVKITTGHNNIFEGDVKDTFFPNSSNKNTKTSTSNTKNVGELNAKNSVNYIDNGNSNEYEGEE